MKKSPLTGLTQEELEEIRVADIMEIVNESIDADIGDFFEVAYACTFEELFEEDADLLEIVAEAFQFGMISGVMRGQEALVKSIKKNKDAFIVTLLNSDDFDVEEEVDE